VFSDGKIIANAQKKAAWHLSFGRTAAPTGSSHPTMLTRTTGIWSGAVVLCRRQGTAAIPLLRSAAAITLPTQLLLKK
jgi:hypothetical protein